MRGKLQKILLSYAKGSAISGNVKKRLNTFLQHGKEERKSNPRERLID